MSSFIVSNECMNNVINGLFWSHQFKDNHRELYKEMNLSEHDDYHKLAEKLYLLNQAAVMQRYPDLKKDKNTISFKWMDETVTPIQFLKSLRCLKYQCGVDHIGDAELCIWMERVTIALLKHIIDSSQEYKTARWD